MGTRSSLHRVRATMIAMMCVLCLSGMAHGQLSAELVISGLNRPVFLTAPPDDDERLFILEQSGYIRIVHRASNTLYPDPFLDIDALTNTAGGERGLLGMAFHPDYATNGFFFVHYTADSDGATVLARYEVSGDPDEADPGSAEIFYTISQPFTNHNGGMLAFRPDDPDNYLYMSLGDGGDADDPNNAGQDLTTPLGSILRIDVDAGAPALAPLTNPFADDMGPNEDLIWVYGLRNPWRFSFDRDTGDMYIGDVGQDSWEEIDFQPASSPGGENYGWRLLEGNHDFNCGADCAAAMDSTELPIHEYQNAGGDVSVTGGYVYRGNAVPSLLGRYVFADFGGSLWSFAFDGTTVTDLVSHTAELNTSAFSISSFGEDASGELYIVDLGGGVWKIAGPFQITVTGGGGFAEVGDSATMSVELEGVSGSETLRWLKNGTPLGAGPRFSGIDATSLTIDPLEEGDSGTYQIEVDDGSKGVILGPEIELVVVATGGLPASGVLGLVVLVALCAVCGAFVIFKK